MQFIRQGATHKVVLGPAVAVGDGFTPVTTLALSTADEAEVILHDNGTVVDISGYTWAAITTADGYYHLTLQSGISNTVGHMTVVVNDDSLCLPLRADFCVIEEAVYDQLFAGSAPGAATPTALATAQTDLDTITGSDGVTLATTQANYAPLKPTTAGRTLDVTATGAAGIDWGNVENQSTVVDLSATDIQQADTAASVTALGAQAKLDVNAEVDTALADYDGPTYTELLNLIRLALRKDAALATDLSALLTTLNADLGSGAGAYANTTDAQEAIRDKQTDIEADTNELQADWADGGRLDLILDARSSQASVDTVDGIVDAILLDTAEIGAAGAGLTEAGGTGDQFTGIATVGAVSGAVGSVAGNVDGNVTGSVGSLATQAKADVNAEADTALSDYDGPTYTELLNFVRVMCRSDAAIATDLLSVITAINADMASGAGDYANTTDAQEAIRDNQGTAQTGDAYAYLGTNLGAAGANATEAGGTGDHLTAVPWNASWDAEVQSEVDDALKATLTEGYRSTGTVGSVRDLLYEIIAHLGESSITSTTKTLKKLDGSTTAKTYTLDSATTPTSITETT